MKNREIKTKIEILNDRMYDILYELEDLLGDGLYSISQYDDDDWKDLSESNRKEGVKLYSEYLMLEELIELQKK